MWQDFCHSQGVTKGKTTYQRLFEGHSLLAATQSADVISGTAARDAVRGSCLLGLFFFG